MDNLFVYSNGRLVRIVKSLSKNPKGSLQYCKIIFSNFPYKKSEQFTDYHISNLVPLKDYLNYTKEMRHKKSE